MGGKVKIRENLVGNIIIYVPTYCEFCHNILHLKQKLKYILQ